MVTLYVHSHQCADDTQLCFFSIAGSGRSIKVPNRNVDKVVGWMRADELKLSLDKTELLLVNDKAVQGLRRQPILETVALPPPPPCNTLLKEWVRLGIGSWPAVGGLGFFYATSFTHLGCYVSCIPSLKSKVCLQCPIL